MGYIGPLRLFFIRANVRAYLLGVGEFESIDAAFGPLLQQAADDRLFERVGEAVLQRAIDDALATFKIEVIDGN